MHDYKFKKAQVLMLYNFLQRVEFYENMLIRTQEIQIFLSKIIGTNKSKFSREFYNIKIYILLEQMFKSMTINF